MAKETKQRASIVRITPAMAVEWLEIDGLQRPISQHHVEFLAGQIRGGTWVVNGESIVRSTEGRILDGQHRLWAVVQSDTAIESWVVEGVDEEYFHTLDTGKSRTGADVAAITVGRDSLSLKESKIVARAVRSIISFDVNGKFNQNAVKSITNQHIADYLVANPNLVESLKSAMALGSRSPIPHSFLLAVYWMTRDGFPKESVSFRRDVITGENLSAGDPALTLRNKAISLPHMASQPRLGLAWTVTAWNAFTFNEDLRVIKFGDSEPFPSIRRDPKETAYALRNLESVRSMSNRASAKKRKLVVR